ncbi:hypothetical protein PQQ63_30070 [Paraburkholderia metrosideri]|uniref:Uncharacterized protein n=1 Tax=Paraburkholderia metrosideri TaxID=580937 RepID=A0ABW9E3X1_9BURK
MSRHRKPLALPPDETSAQLRARLRRFALATRDEATGAATIPFPEHVTVLAGPLRRNRRLCRDGIGGRPEAPASADGPTKEGSAP